MSKQSIIPVIVDVEADGPAPVIYSMVKFAAVAILSTTQFKIFQSSVLSPQSDYWLPEALAISGVTREEMEEKGASVDSEIVRFEKWLSTLPGRPQFWSDNLAFDWQWINFNFHSSVGENPFGYSGRRIGDLYSGMTGNLASRWKHLRKTKHDHNPVNDALGNAEALVKILELMKHDDSGAPN